MSTAPKKPEAPEKKDPVTPIVEAAVVEAPKTEKSAETHTEDRPAAKKRGRKPGAAKSTAKAEKPAKSEKTPKTAKKEKAPKAEKPAARRPRAAKAISANVVLEYQGRQLFESDLVERARRVWADAGRTVEIQSMDLYVKPEDGAVYCVINGEPCGKFYF